MIYLIIKNIPYKYVLFYEILRKIFSIIICLYGYPWYAKIN